MVSKKKKDWLKKSLAAERRQKRTDPEGFKKTLSKRREQVEDTKSRIEKKEAPAPKEIVSTKTPISPTTKETPKVDEPVRLNEPEEEKKQSLLGKIWEPQVFKDLKAEGRLHAGSMPIGIGAGVGGAKAIKISAESMGKIRTSLQNKAIVGKLVETGKGARGATAARFTTNAKSTGLTKSFIQKIGGAPALIAIIGSYPFAGFIKEESLQTLSFGVLSAKNAGNLEGEQEAIDEVNKILDPSVWESLINKIPFANVVSQLITFYKAAAKKNELDQQSLDKRKEEAAGGETDFQRERREGDEAARERELGYRAEDEAYFQNLREESEIRDREERDIREKESEEEDAKFKRIEEERVARNIKEEEAETEKYAKIEEERVAREEEDKRVALVMQDVWRLRREKKYEEADELERTVL